MAQFEFDFSEAEELNHEDILRNLRRDFCGYLQIRDCPASPWKFCVHSIDRVGTYCTCKLVLFPAGPERKSVIERTGINNEGKIFVSGKWYPQSQWVEVEQ